ncbi:MAG: hypothetical protein IIT53_07805 [Fibrobacter sp.]|nr:hypothetical protein [Fibrobacter sp.]
MFLCACTTPTVSDDNSEDDLSDLSGKKIPATEASLITKDVLRYYVFDTLRSVVNYHFNGMCYAQNGVLVWDPEMDHSGEYYSYRLVGDTLFFLNTISLVKTYLRETNDGSALGGRWILLEDESEIFTPEYLIVSGLTAVWEFSIKENAPVTSTDAFVVMMQDIVAEQDGTQHPHQGDYDWGPDWYLMFGKYNENHLTNDELYEYCDPCEDIVRTNTAIEFKRKGKQFKISMENTVHNEKKKSYFFKVVANGKSCVLHMEAIDATKDVCLVKEYIPDDLIEGHTYTSIGHKVDFDKFVKCFKGLF